MQVGWIRSILHVVCVVLAKAHVTRPSDALVGKLAKGTATDWVTRGHLRAPLNHVIRRSLWWLNVQSGQRKIKASVAVGQSEHLKRMLDQSCQHPNLIGTGSPCGKVYSLAGVLYIQDLDMTASRL